MSSFSPAVTAWDQYTVPDANADGVDPNLVRAIMQSESGGRQFSANGSVLTSPTGALGLMQLEPGTAAALGVNPNDPVANIKGGVDYIAQMLKPFGGDQTKAIAGYNAGPNAVDKYGGVPPYAETQAYVKNVGALLAANGSPTPSTGFNWGGALNPLDGKYWDKTGGPLSIVTGDQNGQTPVKTDAVSQIVGGAERIAVGVAIGGVFIALIAGGFAVAASPDSLTVAV